MASLEDELRDLKLKNNDLAQKVQYWKMLAGQREDEKLDLMKEINELRLKLSRLRSNGSVLSNNFDAALQSAAQKALAHLVRASGEIATTMDLAKAYMRDREELDKASPRWSSIGGTPSTAKKDKVLRVPPLIGGQTIQPVVALTMLDVSNTISAVRNSNPDRSVTERAMPMHMLQDVYIPLTRVDVDLHTQNMDTEEANNADDSTGLLQLDENDEEVLEEDSQRIDEDEEFDSTRILDAVTEDTEPENEDTPPRIKMSSDRADNPLEGPSWMLDADNSMQANTSKSRSNLEPDSTTELEGFRDSPPISDMRNMIDESTQPLPPLARRSREFSPTVRRRKRASSPPAAATPRRADQYSPRPAPNRRISNSGRVLKVLVAKMRLDAGGGGGGGGGGGAEVSPPKRAATAAARAASHAPSPNGATTAGVIVSETSQDELESLSSGEPSPRHKQRHPRDEEPWGDAGDVDEQQTNVDRRSEKNEQTHRENEQTNTREASRQMNDVNMEEHQINMDRRTKSRDRRERTNSRERNKISREHAVELQRSDSRERTERRDREQSERTREKNERTNSRERNKQNREHAGERHRSVSRERTEPTNTERENERTNEEQNKRPNSRERMNSKERINSKERNKQTSRENPTEIHTDGRERNLSRQRTNSEERTLYRYKQSRSRERSNDREEDERMESRASNDSSGHDEAGAEGSRGSRADSGDSDSGSGLDRGRGRRARRLVTYKEKPLNRKMRR